MELKIGDIVIDVNHLEWGIGLIVGESKIYKDTIAVRFQHKHWKLHNCDGMCDDAHGFYYNDKMFENLNDLRVIDYNETNTIAKPKWEFTEYEKTMLRCICEDFNWLVRDEDDTLYVYVSKPTKSGSIWNGGCFQRLYSCEHLFKSIKWEDKEPCHFRDCL